MPVLLSFSISQCSSRNVPVEETTAFVPLTKVEVQYEPNDPENPNNKGSGAISNTTLPNVPGTTLAPDPSTVTGATTTTANSAPSSTVPTDKAGIIAYFNSGIDKATSLQRKSHAKLLTKCVISALGDKTNDEGVKGMVNKTDTAPVASDLVKLTDIMVKSATSSTENGKTILNISLNNVSAGTEIAKGQGGYVGILDFNETKTIVAEVAKQILGEDGIELKSPKYTLSSGEYKVTMNTDGSIESVDFTCNQSGNGKVVLVVNVDLGVNITVKYGI